MLEVANGDDFSSKQGPVKQIDINTPFTNFFVLHANQSETHYSRKGPVPVSQDKGVFRFGDEQSFQLSLSADKNVINPYKVC